MQWDNGIIVQEILREYSVENVVKSNTGNLSNPCSLSFDPCFPCELNRTESNQTDLNKKRQDKIRLGKARQDKTRREGTGGNTKPANNTSYSCRKRCTGSEGP